MALIKCPDCEKEFSEMAPACPNCGRPNDKIKVEKINKKFFKEFFNIFLKFPKKAIIVASTIVVAVVIAVVTMFVFPFVSDAISISKLDAAKENYISEKTTYNDALEIISPYIRAKSDKITDYAADVLEDVQDLKESRDSYDSAIDFLDKKDYENAYLKLDLVTNEDSNYDKAQQLKKDNISNLKTKVLSDIDNLIASNNYSQATQKLDFLRKYCKDSDLDTKSTRISNAKKEYEAEQEEKKIQEYKDNQKLLITSASTFDDGYSIILRKARVSLKNTTNQVVRDATIVILQFDNNGYPVDAEYSMYQYGDVENSYRCGADSINLQAYGTWGANNHWNIADGATRIKACVLEAEFYDGTTWENPYFEYWIEKEKDRY